MVKHDMAKVAADNAAEGVRKMNLAEYLEKGIVKIYIRNACAQVEHPAHGSIPSHATNANQTRVTH